MRKIFYRLLVLTAAVAMLGSGTVLAQSDDEVCTSKVYYGNNGFAFSPDSKYLIAPTDDKNNVATVWDVKTGTVARTFSDPNGAVCHFAFTSDGKYLLSSATYIVLWDFQTGKKLYEIEPDGEPYGEALPEIRVSPDNKYFLLTGDGGSQIFDLISGRLLQRSIGATMQLARFSNDSKYVLMSGGNSDRDFVLWDIKHGREAGVFNIGANFAGFVDGGRYVWTVNPREDKEFTLWSTRTFQRIRSFKIAKELYQRVWYSPDGHYLLAEDFANGLVLWDTLQGRQLHTFTDVTYPTFTADNRYILIILISPDQQLSFRVWDIKRNQLQPNPIIDGFTIDHISIIAISPNSHYLAIGGRDELRLYDLTTGKKMHLDC
jgi:WD40 repeat protein